MIFVGLALDGGVEILGGRADLLQGFQMALGMDALGLGRGAEEARNVGIAILLGLLGKGPVLLIGLALAGKGLFEVLYCGCHERSPVRPKWIVLIRIEKYFTSAIIPKSVTFAIFESAPAKRGASQRYADSTYLLSG